MNFDAIIYLKLLGYALVPAGCSLALYLLQRLTVFRRVNFSVQQLIAGIIFGAVAMFSTEYGVEVGGVFASVRDAAPLCAGLLFGGPAGIIAGIIGGVERYFAVYWGADVYLQMASALTTVFAGIYAALLREKLFDRKTPASGVALATGVVLEIVHMTALFLLHMADAGQVFEIIKVYTLPMVISNAAAVFFASVAIHLSDRIIEGKQQYLKTINQKIQGALVVVVIVAYAATTLFVYALQTSVSDYDASNAIDTGISDIKLDVIDSVNANIIQTLRNIKRNYDRNPGIALASLAQQYDVNEINFVDENGLIAQSTDEEYVGFDMRSNPGSKEFLVLLENGGVNEYLQESRANALGDGTSLRKYAGIRTRKAGFLEIGLDFEKFADVVSKKIADFTQNRHIGNTGYVIIADQNQMIISKGEHSGKQLADIGITINSTGKTIPGVNSVSKATIAGTPSLYKFVLSDGYYILGVMTAKEVYNTREASTYVNSFMLVLIFAVIFVLIFFVIKRVVLKDINSINTDVTTIASGDLNVWLHNNSTSEFASLSEGINQAVATLKHYNDKEKERIEEELALAKSIQHSALPTVFPAPAEFNIYAHMRTAKEVGGDFYDFYMVDKNKLVFMIADVSGKGVPAAMFMMTAKTMIKNLTETGMTENEVFNRANEKLCEGNDAGMFVTAWMGVLDTSTGVVKFVNAGHNPPVIYRNGTGYDYLQCKSGFVLSGMEGSKYKIQEFTLQPGDKILLYTDGVTEATNLYNKLYGEDRLKAYLNTVPEQDVAKTIAGILTDIDKFVGKAPQFDDITMVMVQYNGPIPTLGLGRNDG